MILTRYDLGGEHDALQLWLSYEKVPQIGDTLSLTLGGATRFWRVELRTVIGEGQDQQVWFSCVDVSEEAALK